MALVNHLASLYSGFFIHMLGMILLGSDPSGSLMPNELIFERFFNIVWRVL